MKVVFSILRNVYWYSGGIQVVKYRFLLVISVAIFMLGFHCVDNAMNLSLQQLRLSVAMDYYLPMTDKCFVYSFSASELYHWGIVLLFVGLVGAIASTYFMNKGDKV